MTASLILQPSSRLWDGEEEEEEEEGEEERAEKGGWEEVRAGVG